MTTELDAAILRVEALELLGELNLAVAVIDEAYRAAGKAVPPGLVALTMTMPVERGTPADVALGQRGKVVRVRHRRGRPDVAEVAFSYRQVRAMVDRLEAEVDDLAPAPAARVAALRAHLETLTPEELKKLHRETFPEEYAQP